MRSFLSLALALLVVGCGAPSPEDLRMDASAAPPLIVNAALADVMASVYDGANGCFHGKRIRLLNTIVGSSRSAEGEHADVTVFQLGAFDPIMLAQIDMDDMGDGRTRIAVFNSSAMPADLPELVRKWAGGQSGCRAD